LPLRWENTKVSLKDAYRIRRVYRRLAGMRGREHLRRLTVFVRHENVQRLLELLGVPSAGVAEDPVVSVEGCLEGSWKGS